MLDLMGRPVLALATAGAVVAVVAAVALAVRPGSEPSWPARLLRRAVPVLVLALVAQACAVLAFALAVNDSYAFYTSWADLTGGVAQGTAISTHGLVGTGQGRVEVMTVHHPSVGRDDQVLVWLPPEYDAPAYAHRRFPVVMFLSGQPSTPQLAFSKFDFGRVATEAIARREVPPFVAVFPTLMVSPPRDTECTDVPGGPRAETWLSTDVPAFVDHHLRVQPRGPDWSLMGWSTGGFCSAKLVAAHPAWFGSAASFGGYYQPLEDRTTGDLFGGRPRLRFENSPQWLYGHLGGLHGSRLLIVSGRQDRDTWTSTARMLRRTAGDPAVSHVAFPVGGHNYRNYSAYLTPALRWGARGWGPSGTS